MKKIALFTTLLALVLASGCNTIAGVGKDIKKGGEAIEKAVK